MSSSTILAACSSELQTLKSLIEKGNYSEAKFVQDKLKISIAQLSLFPPSETNSPTCTQEKLISREALEWFTVLSVQQEDMASFDRNVAQLKIYYNDFSEELPVSQLRYPILGMRLLHFLIENRMADFHGELELISEEGRKEVNVEFAMKLEQYLMEGSYSKLLEARSHVPHKYYTFFMKQLLDTVRDAVAECAEVAYENLQLKDAQRMLMFDTPNLLTKYIQEQKPEWTINGDRICFKAPEKSLGAADIPSLRLVQETLVYATELDRIV